MSDSEQDVTILGKRPRAGDPEIKDEDMQDSKPVVPVDEEDDDDDDVGPMPMPAGDGGVKKKRKGVYKISFFSF